MKSWDVPQTAPNTHFRRYAAFQHIPKTLLLETRGALLYTSAE
jgi:hypothetical protein